MSSDLSPSAAPAPWSMLLAPGTSTVPIPWRPGERRKALEALGRLPAHSTVALAARGPLSRFSLRRAAARTGIVLEHEYVVLPSLDSSRFVVEDDPDTIALLWRSLAAPPPRLTRGTVLLTALASLGRRRAPWWALGAAAPRVATGRRR